MNKTPESFARTLLLKRCAAFVVDNAIVITTLIIVNSVGFALFKFFSPWNYEAFQQSGDGKTFRIVINLVMAMFFYRYYYTRNDKTPGNKMLGL